MATFDVSMIGVNLAQNENVFLGAILKFNAVNHAVVLVKQADNLTEKTNSIIEFLKNQLLETKTIDGFASRLKKSKDRMLVYSIKLPISHPTPSAKMIVDEILEKCFRIFSGVEIFEVRNREVKEFGATKVTVEETQKIAEALIDESVTAVPVN